MNTQQTFDPDQFMIDAASEDLKAFMPRSELLALQQGCKGEEKAFFITKMVKLAAHIMAMPQTYQTDGQCDQAIAQLHYFKGSGDWYITEKDMYAEQEQAFGLADLGYGPELGYISIKELVLAGVELDLYFTPCALAAIKAKKAA